MLKGEDSRKRKIELESYLLIVRKIQKELLPRERRTIHPKIDNLPLKFKAIVSCIDHPKKREKGIPNFCL